MTTLIVETTVGESAIPAGVTPGPYCFRLKRHDGSLAKFWRTPNPSPTLDGAEPGSYILAVQREGTNQEPIGAEISKPAEVPDMTPKTQVPVDFNVTFAP